ncbi:hypothetical protein [Thalassorhabdomicrobium marinisediminis]|uniref:hypothetical protein n=1 Tax=Thalassorhabdomicrobium marinisediminis TaxID=2170577 RepID=UPI002493AC20|nr:hypothetical protein [Thalassorhabdomicrobium marinisediminis]
MALANLIDLIAEVAAKRTAREGNTKAETPEQACSLWWPIMAIARPAGISPSPFLEFAGIVGILLSRRSR